MRRAAGDEEVEILVIGREQHQRAQPRGTDGVALGDRLGGVADRVERIGRLAHLFRQARHLGDAAGIVGDRAEGVERHDHAGEREHGGDRDRDAEQARELVGDQDAGDDHDRRQRGGFQRNGQALDDVGAVAGDRGLGDRLHRAEVRAGVVLGDDDDQQRHGKTDQRTAEQAARGEGHALHGGERRREAAEHQVVHGGDRADREHTGGNEALVERAHDRLAGAELHEEGADDRRDDADAADGERIGHHLEQHVRPGAAEEDRRQHHGGHRRHRIGLEQIGRHAGAIAHVVTDVVGDGGGVARIVFRDAGLDLADEIAAHVSAFGENPAAETGEDRDQRGPEAQRHQCVDDGAIIGRIVHRSGEEAEIEGDAEQREACDQQPGDGAGLEGELEAAGKRSDRRLGGANIGAHRDVHADEAGQAREDRADQEADRDQASEEVPDDQEDHDPDDRDGGVLALEIGLCALTHGARDFLHTRIAGIGREHGAGRPNGVDDCEHAAEDDQPESCHWSNPGLNGTCRAKHPLPSSRRAKPDGRSGGAWRGYSQKRNPSATSGNPVKKRPAQPMRGKRRVELLRQSRACAGIPAR